MIHPIYPCLWFDGQAKEAADFYCSVFKNSKIISTNPMVTIFELSGKKFMGLNGGPMFKFTPSVSIFVTCETVNETNETWKKIMDGGKALIPIDKQPWSERYGWAQDKFGMTWQISVVNNPGDKPQLRPSFLFTNNQFGRAEEAIKFYSSVFDKSSTDFIMHYPNEDKRNAGKVMYSEFKLNGYDLIAMDGPDVHDYTFNEAVSVVVECDTQKEIDFFWNKLTEGGEESMCGWLKDKFGVSWQIVPAVLGKLMGDPDRSQRVIQAFMKMKKFDIETLMEA